MCYGFFFGVGLPPGVASALGLVAGGGRVLRGSAPPSGLAAGTLRGVEEGITGVPPPPVAGRVTGGAGGPAAGVARGGGAGRPSAGGVGLPMRIGVALGSGGATRAGVAVSPPKPLPSKV
jgi:hypothetical protein